MCHTFSWIPSKIVRMKRKNPTHLGNILFNNCSVFFFSMSSCSVRSLISSSRLFEYFSSIWNIVSTMLTFLPWFSFLKCSWTVLKSGLISGCSAQHWRMIFIASGGAAPLLTEGLIRGGGRFTFSIISETNCYGRLVTCCMRIGQHKSIKI